MPNTRKSWKLFLLTDAVIFLYILAAAVIYVYVYLVGIFVHSMDRFEDVSEHQVSKVERSCTIPLLQEKTGETSLSPAQSEEY